MADVADDRMVETAVAALAFALTFIFGKYIHPLKLVTRDRRSFISFSAGMSVAYVFVDVFPELASAHNMITRVHGFAGPVEKGIYVFALLGFLAFYGLEHLTKHPTGRLSGSDKLDKAFGVHLTGFALYAFTLAYLLVDSIEGGPDSVLLYTIAIALHFLTIDHALQRDYGAVYQRHGKWILAAACIAGWVVASLITLPLLARAMLLAFVSGGVIVNSAISELPTEKDGRWIPLFLGGLLYSAVLIALA